VSALPSKTRSNARLGMLDALRFLAAFSVVMFHFTARNSPAWGGPVPAAMDGVGQWTLYGRLGVNLFFVISGFVLLMSSWGKDLPSFVASRVGRLFPAYWVSAAGSIALVLYIWPGNPLFFHERITTSSALLNLTMVQSAFGAPNVEGVYWTLWYEARFYFLIALLMLVGMTRKRILAFAALWPIAGSLASGAGSSLLTTVLMPDYAPFFAAGMLLYLIYRDGHDLGSWLLVGMNALFALDYALRVVAPTLANTSRWQPSSVGTALCTFACFALVALVTLTPVARWHGRWMSVAGALTYPLYLVHENFGWAVIRGLRASMGPWGAVLVATICALAGAVALHYLVEQPFGARLRRATLAMLNSAGRPGIATQREGADRAIAPAHAISHDQAVAATRHERAGSHRSRVPGPRLDNRLPAPPTRPVPTAPHSARPTHEPTHQVASPRS
jgi:peptidoglycan/LPS O-acetylase OafA/YrhL